MKSVQYKWDEVFFRNSQRSRLRGSKYIHHIDYASFQGVSFFKKAPIRFKKHFKNVKYVSKCTFNESNQIDEKLKQNFPHSKNSIQTISLRRWYRLHQEVMLEENVDMNKILSCAKNLHRVRWETLMGMTDESMTKWTDCVPRNGLQGLRIPLPKHFQMQFEFNFAIRIPETKFSKLPKFQARITCLGSWKIVSAELLIWAGLMKDVDFGDILGSFKEIERLSVSIVGQKNELEDIKKLWNLDAYNMINLRRLELKADIEKFSPSDLQLLKLPERLEALILRIETVEMLETEKTMGDFLAFGKKINSLKGLKTLDLRLPTTFYVNQMLHDMKAGMDRIEEVSLEFVEDKKHAIYEEFYVNSYIEWLATMPKLKKMKLRTTKLNYTYCSFLAKLREAGGFENLESLEWIDDSLEKIRKCKRDLLKAKIWVECKKPEDLGIVLGLINEEKTENIEIPFVFDGLTGDVGLRKFSEKVGRMRNLKRLATYVGFKLLEKENIELVQGFLKGLKESKEFMELREVQCFVCYRELTKEAREYKTEIEKRRGLLKKGDYKVMFVLCPCP